MTKSFVMKKWFLVISLSLVSVCFSHAHANQNGQIEQQIRADKDYDTNVAKARSMLQARGYQVKEIKAGAENGQKCLEVEAYKGASKYEVKLDYPNLKIIKEKLDK
ncbi:MAG: PepSY domain-containing protein [Moraxella sp.]|nr:PepSY domain-containing protein [Moraxella sp.]